MIHTIYHNYSDEELLRYALDTIQHPAVVEVCQRLRTVDFELGEQAGLEEELDQAKSTIDDLNTQISDLEDEIADHLTHIESLEADLEELNGIPN